MSDPVNPYQSPGNMSVPEDSLTAKSGLTSTMLRYLKEASPWLRFIGILGFIMCGLTLVGGLIFSIITFAVSTFANEIGGAFMGLFGLLYVVIAIVMFFPVLFTYNFGSKIRSYLLTNSEGELEQAFKNNKSLWKFYGILCIIYLAFIPLGIVGAVIAAIGSAIL